MPESSPSTASAGISNVEAIAVGKSIRQLAQLRRQYGAGRWRKMKGIATVRVARGDLRRAEIPYYLRTDEVDALNYLEQQVTGDDVVLASLDIGQFVPALTGARSFLGHWAQTLDFYGKTDSVKAFFSDATADDDRLALLRNYGVDYVIYSPQEAALGDYDPAAASYLDEVYSNDNVRVYAVRQEVAGAG